jgi:hypothetical protein
MNSGTRLVGANQVDIAAGSWAKDKSGKGSWCYTAAADAEHLRPEPSSFSGPKV